MKTKKKKGKGIPRGTQGRSKVADRKKQIYAYYPESKIKQIENIMPCKHLIPILLDKYLENNM